MGETDKAERWDRWEMEGEGGEGLGEGEREKERSMERSIERESEPVWPSGKALGW